MTNEDRVKIIEILICASDCETGGIAMAANGLGYSKHWNMAANLRREQQNFFYDSYEEECVAAAYELIEQSATLRKEWFGK